ncbi:hypothetical protein HZS_2756, partial [Henneguya salminicola]
MSSSKSLPVERYNSINKSIHDDVKTIKDSFLAMIQQSIIDDSSSDLGISQLLDENLSSQVRTTAIIASANSLFETIKELKEFSVLLDYENYTTRYNSIDANNKQLVISSENTIKEIVKTLEKEGYGI